MSNIVINDLEHNVELDRKSLIELKGGTGGTGAPLVKIRRKVTRSNIYIFASYSALLSNGRSSFRRGPNKGPISDRFGNASATSSATSSAIG